MCFLRFRLVKTGGDRSQLTMKGRHDSSNAPCWITRRRAPTDLYVWDTVDVEVIQIRLVSSHFRFHMISPISLLFYKLV